jgi:hypothetical protein
MNYRERFEKESPENVAERYWDDDSGFSDMYVYWLESQLEQKDGKILVLIRELGRLHKSCEVKE